MEITNSKRGIAFGVTSLLTAITSLIIASTAVVQNRVSPSPNIAADSLATIAFSVKTATGSTATGGLATYDTLRIRTPFNASTASLNGLNTGTGVVAFAQLDIVANPANVGLDCSIVGGVNTATGGTLLFNNVSGTGTVHTFYPSNGAAMTIGPTQYVKCGSLTNPTASFNAKLKVEFSETQLVN